MRGDCPARDCSRKTAWEANDAPEGQRSSRQGKSQEAHAEDPSSVPATGAPLRTSACAAPGLAFDYKELGQRLLGEERTEPAEGDAPGIPALAELLSRLERDECRDGDELVKPWGITVGDLECPDKVSELLERLEAAQRMTASQLRKEYEQRGFFAQENNSSRGELIPCVCNVLVWEALTLPALRNVCTAQGLATSQGDGREQLLLRLAARTWEEYGVCADSFQDLKAALAVAKHIRSLESLGSPDLMQQCRQWGMPVGSRSPAELTSQLKKALIWSRLPPKELREECRQRGIEAPEKDEVLLRRLLGTFWGEWGAKLERVDLTEAFVKQFERLSYLSSASIQSEFQQLGLVVMPEVEDSDMLQQLKDATIWGHLPLDELRHECAKLDLKVDVEDSKTQKDTLVRKLAEHACMASWRERGLLVLPTSDYEVAVRMIESCEVLRDWTMADFTKWYKEYGFPEERDHSKEDLKNLAWKFCIWQDMSVSDLEEECRRHSLNDHLQPEGESYRQELLWRLLCADRVDYWDRKGFQARRLENFDRVVQVVEEYGAWESKSTSELRSLCEGKGMPRESEALNDRQKILELLKKMLINELMVLPELWAECRSLGLTAGVRQDDEDRLVLEERLNADMWVKMDRSYYESKGIPVDRLDTHGVHVLWRQYELIDGWNMEELQSFHKEGDFPAEAMDRAELVKAVKLAHLWRALSVGELRKESKDRGVPQDKVPAPGSADEKQKLEILLGRYERVDAWEAKGFRARSMSFEENYKIVKNYEEWQQMSFTDLQKVYADTGYPRVTAGDRSELLGILKVVLVWESLPLTELRKDCRQRQIRVQEGSPDERPESIRWLVHSTFANTWALRGIPAERLGSIELAHDLCKQVDRLHATVLYCEMVGQGAPALEEEYKKKGVPFDSKLDNQALLDRLRDLLVWKNLPIRELQRECRAHGISVDTEQLAPKAPQSSLTLPSFMQSPPNTRPGGRRLLAGAAGSKPGALGGPNSKVLPVRSLVSGTANQAGLLPPINKSVKTNDVLGRIAQTKDAKEEEEKVRTQMIDRLVLTTWRDTWKPRGIPAERLDSVEVAESLLKHIDTLDTLDREGLKAEYQKQGASFSEHKDNEELKGRLRNILVWDQLPAAELRRECRERGIEERCFELEQRQLVELLFQHAVLLESEAQGVPALRIADWQAAVNIMENVDSSTFSELKAWYGSTLGFPEEGQLTHPELVKIAKLVTCWQEMPMEDLEQQCRLKGIAVDERGGDGSERRERLVYELLCEERMDTWELRGFQARRFGNFDAVYNVVGNYESYRVMGDLDLLETYRKAGLPERERTLSRDERLGILKTCLIWELLPAGEVRKVCDERGVEVDYEGDPGDGERLEMLERLKVDLEVKTNEEKYTERNIPVSRLGSWNAHWLRLEFDRLEEMKHEELVHECWARQFPVAEHLPRTSLKAVLQDLLTWQYYDVKQLHKDCVDRDLAQEGELGRSEKSREPNYVRRLLHQHLHVKVNEKEYIDREIPFTRFGRGGHLKAYEVFEWLDEAEEWDIDRLRAAQEEFNMPPAPSQPRAELLRRVKDDKICGVFPLEELEAECRKKSIPLLEPVPGAGQPNETRAREAELRDRLRLHRCAKTWDEEKMVQWQSLQTCSRALKVLREWNELDDMPSSRMREKYIESVHLLTTGMDLSEVKENLKKVHLWTHLPIEELQRTCAVHGVSFGRDDLQYTLVKRLAKNLWPPKPEPEPERPKPKPKPKPKPTWPPPKGGYPFQGGYRCHFGSARQDSPRSRMAPYFQVLQLAKTAGIEDVKKSYRRLALKHHPDKNRGVDDEKVACENFRKVAEAYEKLSEFFLNSGTKP